MSKFTFQQPVIHIPAFKEFQISGGVLQASLESVGCKIPLGMFDSVYYYTDCEGWAKVLSDLAFKSDLYKAEKFDCEDYAMKAFVTVRERYGLNTFGLVIGDMPQGRHGFNILYDGGEFLLFEPNAGFGYGGAFPINYPEYGYRPDQVVI